MQRPELFHTLHRDIRILSQVTVFILTTVKFLPALPVVSEISVIGGERGVAVSFSADAPFSASFSGKEKSAAVVLKGCVYGLSEFSYSNFSPISPLRSITAREKEHSTVELTISLKTNVKLPIKAVQRSSQWIALLSDEPVQSFTWNSTQSASQVTPVNKAVAQPQKVTVPQQGHLENVRFLQRGQVSELALEFDREVSCSLSRKGPTVTVTVENARNHVGKRLSLPGNTAFKQLTVREYDRDGTAVLGVSIIIDTAQIESNFNIVFTKGSVLSLFAMNRDNRKATLWTSGHGLSWDYQFYDVPSYNVDLQSMGNRARHDANQKLNPEKTFSIKEPPAQPQAAPPPVPDQVVEVPSPAAATPQEKEVLMSVPMIVTANNLNLRSSPSLSGKVAGKLVQGDVVTVLEKGSNWHKVESQGLTGYVAASYLRERPTIDETANRDIDQDSRQKNVQASQTVEPPPSITKVSTIKSPEPASPPQQTVTAPEIVNNDSNQSAGSATPLKRIIRYNGGGGRDPFQPIVPSSVSLSGLPFVHNLTLVGILYDDDDHIALCEDRQNGNQPFSFREHDPVEKGKVLKIFRDKVVFLITEFGISRSFTLEIHSESPEKEVRKQ